MSYDVAYRGLRVPWVTRWQFEEVSHPVKGVTSNPIQLGYYDQRPEDTVLDTLWLREVNELQGEGEAQFKVMSTTRQRSAMLERRCQVCGEPIEGEVTPYVFPVWIARNERRGGVRTTTTPPTCKTCIPIAAKLCPVLRKGENVYFEVSYQRPAAIFGDTWQWVNGRVVHSQGETPIGAPYVLARQIIMELVDVRKRPLPT